MYGSKPTTTISVKLYPEDVELLDSIRPAVDGEKLRGNIDPRSRWTRGWGRIPGRGEALRAALRKLAGDLQQGKTETIDKGKTAATSTKRKTSGARKGKTAATSTKRKTSGARKGKTATTSKGAKG